MYIIKKLVLHIFFLWVIISGGLTITSLANAKQAQTNNVISEPKNAGSSYDDFDALADDMIEMGVAPDAPKPLSTFDHWAQQICSPIIMKYVALKGYLREWCYWMIGTKKSENPK